MATSKTKRPYKAEQRGGYWIMIDTRTGEAASYPTTERNARGEAAMMNRCYAEAVATLAA